MSEENAQNPEFTKLRSLWYAVEQLTYWAGEGDYKKKHIELRRDSRGTVFADALNGEVAVSSAIEPDGTTALITLAARLNKKRKK